MQALSVDLQVFTLASMLQAAESDRVTGGFRFQPEGEMVLYEGAVVDAVYGRLSGLDAALTLLMVKSTALVFEAFEVEPRPALMDTMAMIIDGARLNDDWATLAPQVLSLREGVDTSDLPTPVRRALKALNGSRIVNEALDLYGIDIIEVIDDLLDLRENGDLIEVAAPRPERIKLGTATPAPVRKRSAAAPAAPQTPSGEDFYDLLDDSRTALRSKDYGRALSLLERAQALQPNDRTVEQNIRRIRQLIEPST